MDNTASRNTQSRADELEERLIDFAVRIIRLSASLPRSVAGKHVGSQIMRSGTSPAPNYGEARGAESHADFVHKLRIVLKELNENVDLAAHNRAQSNVEGGVHNATDS
jgi:four helix bundle protein